MSKHTDSILDRIPPFTAGDIADDDNPIPKDARRHRPVNDDKTTPPPNDGKAHDKGAPGADTGTPLRYPTVTARELFATVDAPTPWLIPRFLPLDDVTVVLAHPKAGKTWIATELGIAVAFGVPVFGLRPTLTGPVLLWLAEDGSENMKSRVRALLDSRAVDDDDPRLDNLHIHTRNLDRVVEGMGRTRLDVTDEKSRAAFIAHAKTIKPVLVVLDTMMTVAEAQDENSASVMQKVMRYMREIRDELQCTVLVTHHFGKDNENNKGRDVFQRARGSSAMRGAWDGAFALEPMRKTEGEAAERFKVHFEMRGVDGGAPMVVTFAKTLDGNGRALTAAFSVTVDDAQKRDQDVADDAFKRDTADVLLWFQRESKKAWTNTFTYAEVATRMGKAKARTKVLVEHLAVTAGLLVAAPGARKDSPRYRLKVEDDGDAPAAPAEKPARKEREPKPDPAVVFNAELQDVLAFFQTRGVQTDMMNPDAIDAGITSKAVAERLGKKPARTKVLVEHLAATKALETMPGETKGQPLFRVTQPQKSA